jgi:hypothetical protein
VRQQQKDIIQRREDETVYFSLSEEIYFRKVSLKKNVEKNERTRIIAF